MAKFRPVRFLNIGIKGVSSAFPRKAVVLYDLLENWKMIVGDVIYNHTIPVDVKNGALIIKVDDPIWIQELSLHKDELKRKVHTHLRLKSKMSLIRFLKFINGEVDHTKKSSAKYELEIDPEVLRQIDESVAKIEDEELRKSMRNYLLKSNSHGKKIDNTDE